MTVASSVARSIVRSVASSPIRGGGGVPGYTTANATQASLTIDEGEELSIDVVITRDPAPWGVNAIEYDVYLDGEIVQSDATLPYVVAVTRPENAGQYQVRIRDTVEVKEYRTRSVTLQVNPDLTGLTFTPDFWIDDAAGNNSNAGTSEVAAWASLDQIGRIVLAADQTITVRVKSGTYDKATDFVVRNNASTGGVVGANAHLRIVYESSTIADGAAANAISSTNGHEYSGTNTWFTTVYGNGLEVNNYAEPTALSPNGFGNRNTHRLTIYDAHVTNCDDGFSAHDSSHIYMYDCTAQNCDKSPLANVQTSYVECYRCTFTTRDKNQNIGAESGTPTVKYFDCVFVPGTANTFLKVVNGFSADRCQFGTLALRCVCTVATVRDSFINVHNEGNTIMNLQRCYGRVSMRVRNSPSITQTVNQCVIAGPATGQAACVFSDTDFSGGQKIVFTNNIFETASAAAFMSVDAANAGYLVGSASQFFNNILSGSAAFDADLIAADTGNTVIAANVTADALIGAANTLNPDDYGYGPGSPAIGAGVGGVNCGFAIGDV